MVGMGGASFLGVFLVLTLSRLGVVFLEAKGEGEELLLLLLLLLPLLPNPMTLTLCVGMLGVG